MTASPKGTIVRHRELFDQVQSNFANVPSFGYDVVNYWTLNPGNSSLFPWLSHVALSYEFYHFRNLRFVYIPRTGTSTAGVAVLAIEPDADDLMTDLDIPATSLTARQWLTSMQSTVEGSLWNAITLNVPSSILNKFPQRHTRSLEAHDHTVDPRTADVGKFIMGEFGGPANIWAGDLFVEYEVELSVPQMSLESDGNATTDMEVTLLAPSASGADGCMSTKFPFGAFNATVDNVTPVWNGLPENMAFTNVPGDTVSNCLTSRGDTEFDLDLWTLTSSESSTTPTQKLEVQLKDTRDVMNWQTSAAAGTITVGASTASILDPTYWKAINVAASTYVMVSMTRIAVKLANMYALASTWP